MRIAISGTYSVGKTLTSMAVAHLTGIPRTSALTMRELLPISVPGKTLEECNGAEIIMLIVRRNQGRAVAESHLPDEIRFYAEVMRQMGVPAKQHAKQAYDAFVHLPIEFPIVEDGHRPVNERFRVLAEELLLKTCAELEIPVYTAGGTVAERLQKIIDIFGIKPVVSIERAIELAEEEYAQIDMRGELERAADVAA